MMKLQNRYMVFLHDLVMIPLAWISAYLLRFNLDDIPAHYWRQALLMLPLVLSVQGGMFWYFGLYRGVWRFASVPDLMRIFKAVVAGVVVSAVAIFFLTRLQGVPRSVFLFDALLLIMLLGGPRFAYRWLKDHRLYGQEGKNILIVAWTGTRGIISLATALALPLMLDDGSAFPRRHSIIFLAFVVIFVTLVVQGLSLPLLIRMLAVKKQPNEDNEENELRLYLAANTLHFIDHEFPFHLENKIRDPLKKKYETQINNLTKEIRVNKQRQNTDAVADPLPVSPALNAQIEISKFQRELLIKLHKEGSFSDTALKQAELERDVDDLKLDLQLPKEETL